MQARVIGVMSRHGRLAGARLEPNCFPAPAPLALMTRDSFHHQRTPLSEYVPHVESKAAIFILRAAVKQHLHVFRTMQAKLLRSTHE